MKKYHYHSTIEKFKLEEKDLILGKLTDEYQHDLNSLQKNAWTDQILYLKHIFKTYFNGSIFFEFIIPRIGKRADCIIISAGIIFIIEFKVGAKKFDKQAKLQVHDYALDLKNFHRGSHEKIITPILICTEATTPDIDINIKNGVYEPISIGKTGLLELLQKICTSHELQTINIREWIVSDYTPTPTIIEAARFLYRKHNVNEISRSDADANNLTSTSDCIIDIINKSKLTSKKSICFITGVPGAGKTLAGLNIATRSFTNDENDRAVFLSGNGPLINVLREALARDKCDKTNKNDHNLSKKDAIREASTFIQNIHHFRNHYIESKTIPHEKVVVFDEAQRSWTKEKTSKYMKEKHGRNGFNQSEPEILIDVMNRHDDWCTVICLIGGGQEINTGEAGLTEWLNTLLINHGDWNIYASDFLKDKNYTVSNEAIKLLKSPHIKTLNQLHLSVSLRSFRSEKLSTFISLLLNGDNVRAAETLNEIGDKYPIFITRNICIARHWLHNNARGTERTGLVASSGAHRLRPDGIYVNSSIEPKHWFLNNKEDVRSSYALEHVATEFEIQGLELDWTGMCWDANLRRSKGQWKFYSFRGSKWQNINAVERRIYLINAYRVLLTRARQGMIIYIPEGNTNDCTRDKTYYDETYDYLLSCGIRKAPKTT